MGCGESHSRPEAPIVANVYENEDNLESEPLPPVSSLLKEKKIKWVHGTVIPYKKFRAEDDAQALRVAMEGIGTDEDAIIQIVGNRTSAQLKQVAKKYMGMYKRSLEKDFTSELTGKLEHVCVGRLYERYEYDAYCLYRAMKGIGTDEREIIDVLCARTNKEVKTINKIYSKTYKRSLRKELMGEIGGDFEDLIIGILNANRETVTPDVLVAVADAKELLKVDGKRKAKKAAFNKEVGIRLLTTRSSRHLREVFLQFKKIASIDIEQAIEHNTKGDLRKGMLALVTWIKEPLDYYCKVMYDSMKGLGTDEEALIRCVLARCELDMRDIKRRYQKMYHKRLHKSIMEDTSGDFRKVLSQLVYTRHDKSITTPNDLLDASMSDRRKFFREQVKRRSERKLEPGIVWAGLQKHTVVEDDTYANLDKSEVQFFGGTLRSKDDEPKEETTKSNSHLHFSNPLHHESKSQESIGSMDSPRGKPMKKISPRRSVFAPSARSLSRIEPVEKKTKNRKNSSNQTKGGKIDIETIKRESMLTREVGLNLLGEQRIGFREKEIEKKAKKKKKRKSVRKVDSDDKLS